MKPDTQIRTLLERAAAHVPVDTEQALREVLASPRRRARRSALVAVAAALALVAVVLVWQQRSANDEGFARPGSEPQGRIAVVRTTGGDVTAPGSGLFSYDLATEVPSRILAGVGITAAQFSPDGTRVAVTVERDGGASYALIVARADGSDPVALVEHEKGDETLPGPDFISVAWSPDGSRLAYSGRTIYRGRTVSVLNADGTGERVLDGHWEAVSWSPDGSRLLLLGWPAAGPEGMHDLYTMRPDGSSSVRLTSDGSEERNASWSPDGTRILFTRLNSPTDENDTDVYVMNADGSDVRQLSDGPGFDLTPVWSPDGEWIVFASDRNRTSEQRRAMANGESPVDLEIFVMRSDGSDVSVLLDIGFDAIYPLSWTR